MVRVLDFMLSLRTKLTLSYALVTFAALIVAEALIVVALFAFINSGFAAKLMAASLKEYTAPTLARYMESPDPERIEENLLDTIVVGYNAREARDDPEVGFGLDAALLGLTSAGTTLYALDSERRLVSGYPEVDDALIGEPFNDDSPRLDSLVTAALDGEDDHARLNEHLPNEELIAVAPVKGEDGEVLGVVVATVSLPDVVGPLVTGLTVSAITLTVTAGLVSVVFGFFTAWRLSRRLKKITRATDGWSRGDFSGGTKDRSRDEVGRLSRDLNHMAGELQTLIHTRQELAALEARNRFARDLHDSVKQQVFATSLQLDAARTMIEADSEVDAYLTRANEILEGAQRELDGLIHELRPADLDGKGLPEALRDYVAGWSRRSQIPASFDVRGEVRETEPEIQQSLFRVTQEALSNVARHSEAAHAGVELVYGAGELVLRISDDGRGFDPDRPPSEGFGLTSMRERLEGLSGRTEIESRPGEGTVVTCVSPVRRK